MADIRLPLLKELPFRHKGVMCAPLVGAVSLKPYLEEGFIEQVVCGGGHVPVIMIGCWLCIRSASLLMYPFRL